MNANELEAAVILANLSLKCTVCQKNLCDDCQPRKIQLTEATTDAGFKLVTLRACNACGIRYQKSYKY